MKWSRYKTALVKLIKVVQKRNIDESFMLINKFSKKIEKEEIRLDILLGSIHSIQRSLKKFYTTIYLKTFMNNLKASLASNKTKSKEES
jgi:uncharacterized membrane protein